MSLVFTFHCTKVAQLKEKIKSISDGEPVTSCLKVQVEFVC